MEEVSEIVLTLPVAYHTYPWFSCHIYPPLAEVLRPKKVIRGL